MICNFFSILKAAPTYLSFQVEKPGNIRIAKLLSDTSEQLVLTPSVLKDVRVAVKTPKIVEWYHSVSLSPDLLPSVWSYLELTSECVKPAL